MLNYHLHYLLSLVVPDFQVYVISWATLASYVGAGGLGDLVFNGLNLYQPPMIISAAILVTLLALIVDFFTFIS